MYSVMHRILFDSVLVSESMKHRDDVKHFAPDHLEQRERKSLLSNSAWFVQQDGKFTGRKLLS